MSLPGSCRQVGEQVWGSGCLTGMMIMMMMLLIMVVMMGMVMIDVGWKRGLDTEAMLGWGSRATLGMLAVCMDGGEEEEWEGGGFTRATSTM